MDPKVVAGQAAYDRTISQWLKPRLDIQKIVSQIDDGKRDHDPGVVESQLVDPDLGLHLAEKGSNEIAHEKSTRLYVAQRAHLLVKERNTAAEVARSTA